ncbi:uncharacterized protein LOC144148150 isoform X2 [Haemaphysalis longicornis]
MRHHHSDAWTRAEGSNRGVRQQGTTNMTTTPLFGAAALGSARRCRQSIVLQILMFWAIFWRQGASAEPNKNFNMTSLCGDRQTGVYLVEQIVRCCPYMQVDGAVLTDEGNHHPNCVVTFQTHSIFQRLQLRFERLALDCNERLVLVDGRHPDGPHMANLTCETSVSDVGTLLTRTDFVTLKYSSDESGTPTQGRGFKLIITAFKQSHPQDAEQEVPCRDFKCANGFCISSNLTCDGVNHCGDNSDETGSAACVDETSSSAAPQ